MNIHDIETADCDVLCSIKLKNNIWLKFSCLYLINEGRYCSEMEIVIINAGHIKVCEYHDNEGETKTVYKECKYYNFDIKLVQYIKFENGLLILGCFSKRGEWLEISCQSNNVMVRSADLFAMHK